MRETPWQIRLLAPVIHLAPGRRSPSVARVIVDAAFVPRRIGEGGMASLELGAPFGPRGGPTQYRSFEGGLWLRMRPPAQESGLKPGEDGLLGYLADPTRGAARGRTPFAGTPLEARAGADDGPPLHPDDLRTRGILLDMRDRVRSEALRFLERKVVLCDGEAYVRSDGPLAAPGRTSHIAAVVPGAVPRGTFLLPLFCDPAAAGRRHVELMRYAVMRPGGIVGPPLFPVDPYASSNGFDVLRVPPELLAPDRDIRETALQAPGFLLRDLQRRRRGGVPGLSDRLAAFDLGFRYGMADGTEVDDALRLCASVHAVAHEHGLRVSRESFALCDVIRETLLPRLAEPIPEADAEAVLGLAPG